MKAILPLPLLLFPLAAQPPRDAIPKDVENFIRDVADGLTNKDSRAFLDHFDPKMSGYQTLNYQVEALVAQPAVTSAIEIASDKGDDKHRQLALDWVLYVDTNSARRKIVNVTIEKQGKKWKITALDPIDFFKPTAAP